MTTHNPTYGPGGETFCVAVQHQGSTSESWYWTAEEAQRVRDRAYDMGFKQVRVRGLPTTVS